MIRRFQLGKDEKLKSKREIDEVFANGKRLSVFPISASYVFFKDDNRSTLKTGFTATKKNFKKAVDRNRIKRLLREAYRLQKHQIVDALKERGLHGHVFFMYTDKTIASYTIIKESMYVCLQRMQQKLPI